MTSKNIVMTNKHFNITSTSNTNIYVLIRGMLLYILALYSTSIFAQVQHISTKEMITAGFTTTLLVDQSPKEVFNAINNPRGWWSEEIEGRTAKLNDEFAYHYKNVHIARIKLIEVVPNKKVVWLVVNNRFNFTKDKTEWTGTKICFEIYKQDNKTQIRFTHLGLVPQYECYDICTSGWDNYINNSLRNLIATGKGQPNPKEGGFNEQLLQQLKNQ
jgi:hypothetical protein